MSYVVAMSHEEPRISEQEARVLWRRASELQAEAARRLEARSRQLAPRDDSADGANVDGYRLADVRAAAEEAGISVEFVDHALMEARSGNVDGFAPTRPSGVAARFLGKPTLEVSRVLHAPASDVYAAMQRILPERPFRLNLVDHYGADPVEGGVLVFQVPAYSYTVASSEQPFAYEMLWANLKRLSFSLRRLDTDSPATELTVRASLIDNQKLNMGLGGAVSGSVGSMSGVVAGAALGLGGVSVVALLGVVALGTAAAAMLGWRGLYRYGVRRAEKAIRNLIGSISVDVKTGGGFSGSKPVQPVPDWLAGFLREGRGE